MPYFNVSSEGKVHIILYIRHVDIFLMFFECLVENLRRLMGSLVSQVDMSVLVVCHESDTGDDQSHEVLFQSLMERRYCRCEIGILESTIVQGIF